MVGPGQTGPGDASSQESIVRSVRHGLGYRLNPPPCPGVRNRGRVKLLLLFFLPVVVTATALAATPNQQNPADITVTEELVESIFPDGVRFHLAATGPDEIDDIRVYFKLLGQKNQSAYRAMEFEPGASIRGEAILHSGSRGEHIPPGTRVEYSFEIRDTAGRSLRTDDQVYVYLDHNFDWQTKSDGSVTVYYNEEIIEGRAGRILETATETLGHMGPILGVELEHPLHIVAYSDYRDMVHSLPFTSQATRAGLITQGTAFSEVRSLLVLASGTDYLGTTSHEFTHLLVADATGASASRVPRWLNEGLAEYGNLHPSPDYDSALARAIRDDEVRPLWFQNTFSGTPDEVIVAYGQGKSVVEYLLDNHGEDKMAVLMATLADTLDIDEALQQTYGFTFYDLDTEWRKSVGLEASPPPPTRETRQRLAPPTARPIKPVQAPSGVIQQPTPTPIGVTGGTEPGVEEATEGPNSPQQSTPGCGASRGFQGADPALPLLVLGGLGLVWGSWRKAGE